MSNSSIPKQALDRGPLVGLDRREQLKHLAPKTRLEAGSPRPVGDFELPGAERTGMAPLQLRVPGETLTPEGEARTGEAVERLSDVLDVV
jgi:hypothetical protein